LPQEEQSVNLEKGEKKAVGREWVRKGTAALPEKSTFDGPRLENRKGGGETESIGGLGVGAANNESRNPLKQKDQKGKKAKEKELHAQSTSQSRGVSKVG